MDAEALLRQRLLPCQLDDLERTGTFCVRGGMRGLRTQLYRICVKPTRQLHNGRHVTVHRRVVDERGNGRNFWFFEETRLSRYPDDFEYLDGWEAALALMIFLQARSENFERLACADWVDIEPPSSYGGKI
jgi:hypothetical protein